VLVVIEEYFYVIDGVCFGASRQMMRQEADELNAGFAKKALKARWLRQHEFCWIDEVKL
jgi:hypothetical protein